MIYTLGKTEAYEGYFQSNAPDPTFKQGRTEDYPGGTVWETREQAQAFVDTIEGFKVYSVMASWEADTVPTATGPEGSHDLLRDSLIIESLDAARNGWKL